MRLRCGKEELHRRRWLFKRFEEGVKGLFCEHVHFVDDVDFIISRRGSIAHRFVQLTNIINAAIGGAVDFNHIK